MKIKKSRYYIGVLGIIAVISLFQLVQKPTNPEKDGVYLTKCWDGDTAHFKIEGEDKKVRFLAIDAPEIVKNGQPADAYGDEAAKFTCDALKNAKVIKLEYEDDKTDKYDRVLAWIWVDDQLLQEQIVEKGYARVKYLYDDYRYTQIVQDAEKKAQGNHVGIWGNN